MHPPPPLLSLTRLVWRVVLVGQEACALQGATSERGRFHHESQSALYTSFTDAGAWRAVRPYRRPDDPPRTALRLRIKGARVLDGRDPSACAALSIAPADLTVDWRAATGPAVNWRASDRARAIGADGLLYPSRTNRRFTHLVLFRWNMTGGPLVSLDQPLA